MDFLKKIFALLFITLILPMAFAFDPNGEPSKGDSSAILKIFWFNDFSSTNDRAFFINTLPQIESNYLNQGNVQLFAKDFFSGSQGNVGEKAHEAAECALSQGKFWEYAGKLYNDQSNWLNNGRPVFTQYATDLGLNTSTFDSCLDNSTYFNEVFDDKNEGISNGINSTNSLAVGTAKLNVSSNYSTISNTINTEIAKIAPLATVVQPNGGEMISGNYNIFLRVSDQNNGQLRLDLGYSSSSRGNFSNILTDYNLTNSINCPSYTGNSSTPFNCLVKIWNTAQVADGKYYVNARVKGDFNSSIDVSDSNFTTANSLPLIFGNIPTANFDSNKSDQNIEINASDATAGIDVSSRDFNITQDGRRINGNSSFQFNPDNKNVKFTFLPTTSYSDGKRVDVNFTIKNMSGKSASYAYSFKIDLNAPSQIVDLNAQILSGNSIQLTWTQSIDINSGFKQYNIYRSHSTITGTNKGNPYAIVTTNSYNDTNVADGTTYYYAVTAADNAGNESSLSNQQIVLFRTYDNAGPTISVTYPTQFGFTNRPDQNITIRAVDNISGVNVNSFDINIWQNNSIVGKTVSNSSSDGGKTVDFIVRALNNFLDNQRIDVNVFVQDNRGNSAFISFYFIVDLNKPNKISDLSGIARNGSVSLSWSPSIDSNSGINHYNIYKSISYIADSSKPNTHFETGNTNYTDTTGANGEYNFYVVTAVDNAGNESLISNYAYIAAKQQELEINPAVTSASMQRNDTISLSLTVANNSTGKICPIIDINSSSYRLTATASQKSFCLNPKSQTNLTVSVSSGDASDGIYTINVIASSGNYVSVSTSTITIGQANPNDDVIFGSTNPSICNSGGENTISVSIENKSSSSKKLSLSAENDLFIPYFNPSSIVLAAGEKRLVELKLHTTTGMAPGQYSTNVYAFDEVAKKTYKSGISFNLANCNNGTGNPTFELVLSNSCNYLDKNRTSTAYYTVRNLLNSTQTVTISTVSDIPTNSIHETTLAPNEQKSLSFNVNPRIEDNAGNHYIKVYVWNEKYSMFKEACVYLNPANALDLQVKKNNLTVERGKSEVFTITVRNTGDYNNWFNVGVNNPFSQIRTSISDTNFSLSGRNSYDVYVMISPSDTAALGEYSIIFTASSAGKISERTLNFKVVEAIKSAISIDSFPEKIVVFNGKSKSFTLIISNNSNQTIENIRFELQNFNSSIKLEQNQPISIKAGETKEVELSIKAENASRFGMQFGLLKVGNSITNTTIPLRVFVQQSGSGTGINENNGTGNSLTGLISFGSSIILGLIVLAIIVFIIVLIVGIGKSKSQKWVKQ